MRRSLFVVLSVLGCDPRPAPPVVEREAPVVPVAAPTIDHEPLPPVITPERDDPNLVVPDSLVADGIPPIPRTIVEAVGAYSEARSAGVFDWHPVERTMMISTRFADTAQVHEVRGPGADRRQLTFFRDRVTAASWPPVHRTTADGEFFVFARDVGGDEFAQLWRLDRGTGKSTLLTDGKSKNNLGPWSNSGTRVAYSSTRRNGKDTDIYVVDPADPSTDVLVAEVEGGGWSPLDWSPDDGRLLLQNYVSVNESELWELDLSSKQRTRLTQKTDTPVAWDEAAYTADGTSVVSASDVGGEFKQLVRITIAGGAVAPLTAPLAWDIADFAVSRDRRQVAAIANEGGSSRLHLYDLATGRERPLRASVPVGVISGPSWHADGRHLAFTLSSARSPADVYVLDVKQDRVERWTESEVGGLDPRQFSEPQEVRWKSFDGREIPGFYYRPPARFAGKRPVVVVIHGGPEGQSQTGFIARNNYFLNELGVALIYPNVRGSTGYGKTYVALDNGFLREDSVKDIGALLDWIATQPDLDKDRVAVAGGSYGGYMVLAAMTHYNDRLRAGFFAEVIAAGVLLHPRHLWFISHAHTAADIEHTLVVADQAMVRVRERMAGSI